MSLFDSMRPIRAAQRLIVICEWYYDALFFAEWIAVRSVFPVFGSGLADADRQSSVCCLCKQTLWYVCTTVPLFGEWAHWHTVRRTESILQCVWLPILLLSLSYLLHSLSTLCFYVTCGVHCPQPLYFFVWPFRGARVTTIHISQHSSPIRSEDGNLCFFMLGRQWELFAELKLGNWRLWVGQIDKKSKRGAQRSHLF